MNPLLVGAGISALGSLASSAINASNVARTNALNEDLQREQWARDDNQYQRTVEDMRKAGLNPLAGVNPQSSPLSVQAQAPTFENPLQELPSIIQAQAQLNLQNKSMALQAIKSGVNPDDLEKFSDNKLLNAFRDSIIYQAQENKKNAESRGNRYSGIVGKTVNDIRDALPEDVNDVVDTVLEGAGTIMKRSASNAKKVINDTKPVVKSAVKHGSKLVQDAKVFNKKVKNWFDNKFGKKNK